MTAVGGGFDDMVTTEYGISLRKGKILPVLGTELSADTEIHY